MSVDDDFVTLDDVKSDKASGTNPGRQLFELAHQSSDDENFGNGGGGDKEVDSDEERRKQNVDPLFNAVPNMEDDGEDSEDDREYDSDDPNIFYGKPTMGSLHRLVHPAKLARRFPREPAARLSIDSMSAYAPFQGLPMQWMSEVYDDAATYEGTEYANQPHGKGVFHSGVQGGGLGINDLKPGDRYEGELFLGFASGLGMLSRQDGRVYRGEFLLGRMHGCGAQVDMSPFYEQVAAGLDPEEAWEKTKEQVAATTQRGTFRDDALQRGPVEDGGGGGDGNDADSDGDDDDAAAGSGVRPSDHEHPYCTLAEVEGTVEEVEHLVARARMFEHKPDGAVSTSATVDANGSPAPLMQDPLHYPFGTKWMAPGPLGQCFRLPDDEATLEAMDAAAHNHELIWREFNLPRVIEPGTDMAEAVKHAQRVASVRLRDAEPDEILEAATEALEEARALAEDDARLRREAEEAAKDLAAGRVPASRRRGRPKERERISEDDLVADVSGLSVSVSGRSDGNNWNGSGGSVFGSVTASLFGRGGARGGGGGGSGRGGMESSSNPAALFASALGRAAGAVVARVPVGGRRGLARPSSSSSRRQRE